MTSSIPTAEGANRSEVNSGKAVFYFTLLTGFSAAS
jgi:hypothetical protein